MAGGLGLLKGAATSGKGVFGMLGGAGGALATAGLAAWDIYSTEQDGALSRAQKNARHVENAGGLAGAIAGAKLGAMGGAAVGSVVPGLGTAVGGVAGGLAGGALGYFGGDWLGKLVGNKIFGGGPSEDTKQGARELVQPRQENIKIESVLHLDGREVARAVNEYNKTDSLRN